LIRSYPRLESDARCDVVVLGAGITGALVAQHLAEAGIDMIVLDRRDVASGSTAASTALLQYEIDIPLAELTKLRGAELASRAYLACRGAVDRLGQLADRLPDDVGFARKASLYLGVKKRDRRLLREECELRRAIGLSVEYLEEDEIAARFPFRRPAALLTRDAAQVDPYAFAHALLRDATARGARVFDRTEVESIDATTAGVTIRTTSECAVHAKHIVFAPATKPRRI
jgi:glycine/D-amino acid oxidase-like deaminating enzyme